jgi:hypothetical protein
MNPIFIYDKIVFALAFVFLLIRIFLHIKINKENKTNEKIIKTYRFTIAFPLLFLIITIIFGESCTPFGFAHAFNWLYPVVGWFTNLTACTDLLTFLQAGVIWAGIGSIVDIIVNKFKRTKI